MTAAVSCQPTPAVQMDIPATTPALARKRRREIILSQRASGGVDTDPAVADPTQQGEVLPPKKRKVFSDDSIKKEGTTTTTGIAVKPTTITPQTTAPLAAHPVRVKTEPKDDTAPAKPVSTNGVNKHQRKYEPDVPMTKEEASSWRREQRRKRNRESAAASRQRQRDRISELEAEVEDWKTKFAAVMEKLRVLEESKGAGVPTTATTTAPTAAVSVPELILSVPQAANQVVVSPCPSPDLSSQPSPALVSVASSSLVQMSRNSGSGGVCRPNLLPRPSVTNVEPEMKHHLNENISRQAVKITGDASPSSTILNQDDDTNVTTVVVPAVDMPTPDPVVSSETSTTTTTKKTMTAPPSPKAGGSTEVVVAPAPVSPSSVDQQCAAAPSSSLFVEEIDQEDEMGAFLLDAVEWL
eukprot:CAMPEP_0185723734 /NCGR_PEP_ID=MMETSP1171-20130828/474_1 /TAXON_ID=374046 /ORGANISM="Helicotheca tamensis, Strain CCMP826" /LENGTH=410 /DNA_ID=CAMNT_0028391483 /DNA_START=41 /DNA_END=1276 /DNA_ORIENTATION=+